MIAVDSGHFLLTAINSAEDVSLFLNSYNACTADDVLRSSIVLDHRPLVILGSEKRHTMCKKKLPAKFKELGLDYQENQINFVTEDTLKVFVTETLTKLKDINLAEEVLTTEERKLEERQELILEDPQEKANGETSITTEDTIVYEDIKPEVVEEKVVELKAEPINSKNDIGGLCIYGVPKIRVDYLAPNTLGLQESLFVNVAEEDINNFFQNVKSRVLGSIANDK